MTAPPELPSLIQEHFADVVAAHGDRGPIGSVLQYLAVGALSPEIFDRIAIENGVRREDWFRGQVLDLFLGFMNAFLASTRIAPEHRAPINALRRQLAIPDGEFMAHRPAEVAAIIDEQLDRILADAVIDGAEELEQVELQAAFGLAYDDYLLLSRRAFERLYAKWLPLADHSPDGLRKLQVLEPLYRLVISRPRKLGALF